MDIATLAGMIVAMSVILAAIVVGGNPAMFIDVSSILIVICGTIAATFIRFKMAKVFSSISLGFAIAFMHKEVSPEELIEESVELARANRTGGAMALEKAEISHPFLKSGIDMIIEGRDGAVVRAAMERERDLSQQRKQDGEKILRMIGDAAPAFGMIGTLVGLVNMLGNMSDPASIGPSMAVAILTTLYGAILANAIALPMADKLQLNAASDEMTFDLMINAVDCLIARLSPDQTRATLLAFLPESKRPAEDGELAQAAE